MIFFLYGPDTYRSREKLERIVERFRSLHRSGLNLIWLKEEDDRVWIKFRETIEAVSMFREKKLIIWENVLTQPKNLLEELKEYLSKKKLKNDLERIIVFWQDDEIDKRKGFFKYLSRVAQSQDFKLLENNQLIAWISRKFKKENPAGKISRGALENLAYSVGPDLWQLSQEINKLIAYVAPNASRKKELIDEEDVKLLVKPKSSSNVFEIIDALGRRDKKTALKVLFKRFENGEAAVGLLGMFTYEFRNLIKIKDLTERKIPSYLFAGRAGIHPYAAKKMIFQARHFTLEELKGIYEKLKEYDLAIKLGRIEAATALEDFVVSVI